jgi:hypothetical protein
MATNKKTGKAPEERLEADRRRLVLLAAQCGEEAGLHRPLNDVVGGVITGIPEETDLAQALSDRETSDLLVHLLDQNREQVERALGAAPGRRLRGLRRLRPAHSGSPAALPAGRHALRQCQAHWDRLNGSDGLVL